MSQAGRFIPGTGAPPIETITGNTGGPVPPDGAGNIDLVGSDVVSVTGNPGTNTLTISVDDTVATTFDTDSGTATPVGNILEVLGGTNVTTMGAGNTITINATAAGIETLHGNTGTATGSDVNIEGVNNITVTGDNVDTLSISVTGTTNHALQIGNAGGSLTSLGVATDGQIPIGSTGADPVLATITAGTNITVTNAAGSITIAANAVSATFNYTAVNFAASPYSATATDFYLGVDATGGAVTIRLPNAPVTGRSFVVKDNAGIAATNNITVTTVGGVVNLDGATSFVMNTNYEAAQFMFNGAAYEVF